MKYQLARLCCLLMTVLLLMSFAGCSHEEETGAGYPFSAVLPGDPGCLDPQFSQNENAAIVITNVMEGLLRMNSAGNPVCAGAEEMIVSEDGLSYLFTLREDAYWFSRDMDPERLERVTSRDYVFAFRRLVDPAMRSPYGKDYLCIKNAARIMDGEMDAQHLGVSAPDGNTVLFELDYPNPEFPALLARTCAVPCNQEFFESTNGRYGLDADTILCNGPFYLTQWNYDQYSSGNFLTFRKSKHYHSPDAVYPNNLQFNIMHNRSDAEADFADGNDDVLLTPIYHDRYLHSKDYAVQTCAATTMGLIFNPENTLLQDEMLRQALAYGLDRAALEPLLSEDVSTAYGLVPPAVTLLGSSYRSIEADEPLAIPYDPDKAAELFTEASGNLGLNSLNSIRVMVPSTLTDTDALLAMSQNWQDLFGYYIGIETVTPDEFDSRIASGDYTIALYSFTPERNSCLSALEGFMDAELLDLGGQDLELLMKGMAHPVNLADTAELCAFIEQSMISSCTFVPLFYKNSYLITTAGNEDIRFDPFTMSADFIEAKHFSK